MAISASPYSLNDFPTNLDDVLFDVCEKLQLPPSLHTKADERYHAVARVLEVRDSPFASLNPTIFPQGSMRLGTTVRPIQGPHDLDFVLQLDASHTQVNPLRPISTLFDFLNGHGTYRDMVELKNRCVRLVYADEFYMDILPACLDAALARISHQQ